MSDNVELPAWLVMLVGRLVIEVEAARQMAAAQQATNGALPAEEPAEAVS